MGVVTCIGVASGCCCKEVVSRSQTVTLAVTIWTTAVKYSWQYNDCK